MTWATVADDVVKMATPASPYIAIVIAFAILARISNETPAGLITKLLREFGKLIQMEHSPESINALTLLGAIVLTVIIFATPLSELFLGASGHNDALWVHGLTALLIFAYMVAGLICVRIVFRR